MAKIACSGVWKRQSGCGFGFGCGQITLISNVAREKVTGRDRYYQQVFVDTNATIEFPKLCLLIIHLSNCLPTNSKRFKRAIVTWLCSKIVCCQSCLGKRSGLWSWRGTPMSFASPSILTHSMRSPLFTNQTTKQPQVDHTNVTSLAWGAG